MKIFGGSGKFSYLCIQKDEAGDSGVLSVLFFLV